MTEAEAWSLLMRFKETLPVFNEGDRWELLLLPMPQQSYDEDGPIEDEWQIEVGWHCWIRNSKTAIPTERGIALAVGDAGADAEHIYGLLYRNYLHSVGILRTFRTYDEATEAVFT